MQSNKDHNFAFYAKQWPVLTMPGWEPTVGKGYGLIWWDKPVEVTTDHPATCEARLCFIVNPTSARIDLEVRTWFRGKGSTYSQSIGDGTLTPEALEESTQAALPNVLWEALERLDRLHELDRRLSQL